MFFFRGGGGGIEMEHKCKMIGCLNNQDWTNCAPDADQARLGVQNLSGKLDFSGARILSRKLRKNH